MEYPIDLSVQDAGVSLKIGIVWSRFTDYIGKILLSSCVERLQELGIDKTNIDIASVPGALEIPLALQQFARSKKYNALVAIGVVIRGETYHFDLVANESAAGVSKVGLDFNLTIANAILTTENDEQAQVRAPIKGREAAEVAVECANLLRNMNKG